VIPSSFLTTSFRGLLRRLNRGLPIDSYPYLSGDSYKYSCLYWFEGDSLIKSPVDQSRPTKNRSIFVRVSEVSNFITFLKSRDAPEFLDYTAVLHNGDDVVSHSSLAFLQRRFREIYSVNLVDHINGVRPIPIGLENWSYFTNGIPSDYSKLIAKGIPSFSERPKKLLESFSSHTNPIERGECSFFASQIPGNYKDAAFGDHYRKNLLQSRYVLSPAGNGPDCHRTWEAMYLGAIPIVRRQLWPFAGFDLPVVVIDEWEDLLSLDFDRELVPQYPNWKTEIWDYFFRDGVI
jgi:hypothetical protein